VALYPDKSALLAHVNGDPGVVHWLCILAVEHSLGISGVPMLPVLFSH